MRPVTSPVDIPLAKTGQGSLRTQRACAHILTSGSGTMDSAGAENPSSAMRRMVASRTTQEHTLGNA
jgi:hypothetical protein